MAKKYVYLFKEGNANMRNLLGGKGANLAQMTSLGMPVPQGFVVSTEACNSYYKNNESLSGDIRLQVLKALAKTEKITGQTLGDPKNPLLLSVRSGARASMPGMMDSVLNLGINDEVAEGLAKISGNKKFAYDSYRRFIQMFSNVVKGADMTLFEEAFHNAKKKAKVEKDMDLSEDQMQALVNDYKAIYKKLFKVEFPQQPIEQLFEAITAVFRSWNNERAIFYRKINNIPAEWGTAVNVQQMVFGNKGETSGTGVAFSRNPVDGKNEIFGEYLMNAQGEDVVSGVRTPSSMQQLEKENPVVYTQLVNIFKKLEHYYKDMQDIEFTIENNKLAGILMAIINVGFKSFRNTSKMRTASTPPIIRASITESITMSIYSP